MILPAYLLLVKIGVFTAIVVALWHRVNDRAE